MRRTSGSRSRRRRSRRSCRGDCKCWTGSAYAVTCGRYFAAAMPLHERGLEGRRAGEIQLDAHQPVVVGALEEAGDRRRGDAERARDVLLALPLPVIELEALDGLPELGACGN